MALTITFTKHEEQLLRIWASGRKRDDEISQRSDERIAAMVVEKLEEVDDVR